MKLIAEGRSFVSYRFEPGEERPKELPPKAPASIKFKTCSRCKQPGVFEYT